MGMSAAHRPKKSVISSSVIACMMPATGVRPPFLTLVAVRAIAPVAGMPPNSGATMFATPCATSSMLDLCRVADHAVGDDRGEQRLDRRRAARW